MSNAVQWVLGEQRARLLRGVEMDEVIFQGSSARRPVSVAEVSLHFDNDDGMLPIAYREVVVTRRFVDLARANICSTARPAACAMSTISCAARFSVPTQGVVIESRMIDALLSDRPDDRRELFRGGREHRSLS